MRISQREQSRHSLFCAVNGLLLLIGCLQLTFRGLFFVDRQVWGLELTSASRAAFLVQLTTVIVPVLEAVLGQRKLKPQVGPGE